MSSLVINLSHNKMKYELLWTNNVKVKRQKWKKENISLKFPWYKTTRAIVEQLKPNKR
jgi:hypothetical protein